MLKYELS